MLHHDALFPSACRVSMRCLSTVTRWLAAGLLLIGSAARAAEPGAADPMTERLAACAACHGSEGRTVGDTYYPSIAGKPARYLYAQLVNFRDGRRQHTIMAAMLANLSDRYLGEIATFYARQPHAAQPVFDGATAEQLATGERLTRQGDPARKIPPCQACHGEALTGVEPAIPGLRGLPVRYLDAQISAWKQGARRATAPDCMGQIAKTLTGAEITAISAWLASQPYAPDARPATSLPAPLPLDCGGVLP